MDALTSRAFADRVVRERHRRKEFSRVREVAVVVDVVRRRRVAHRQALAGAAVPEVAQRVERVVVRGRVPRAHHSDRVCRRSTATS